MPPDTTILRHEYGQLPSATDSLPADLQQQIADIIQSQRDNLASDDYLGTHFLAIAIVAIFSIAIFYSNYKTSRSAKNSIQPGPDEHLPASAEHSPVLVYTGSNLNFTNDIIIAVLSKRSNFFNSLNISDQIKFIQRLKEFIGAKTFIIHDSSGFREMPILICATAIQISFGLDTYLLPNFTVFNIYREEFLRTQPFLRFLIGNVSGNCINLSWKHFLEGFEFPADGQNVGMHELAHALYYQNFIVEKNADADFRNTFSGFNDHGNIVYEVEKGSAQGLYSDYAKKDFQEFWAESVEIFFEKPTHLKKHYPDLYLIMSDLLNQDPAQTSLQNIG